MREQILTALEPGNAYPLILDHMLGSGARLLEAGSPLAIEQAFNAFRETFAGSEGGEPPG